jgi:hypothetical protein
MKKSLIQMFFGIAAAILIAGCYTQFAVVDRTPPKQETITEIDSTGDTVTTRVVHTVDTVTIREKDRENCFWTRDYFGAPVLRCYDNYYDQDWYRYNYYPWWYRYDPVYQSGYCRSYEYYDAYYNSCRPISAPCYDCDNNGGYPSGGSSGSTVHTKKSVKPYDRSYGVPGSSAQPIGQPNSLLPKESSRSGSPAAVQQAPNTSIPIVPSNSSSDLKPTSPSYGVPSAGNTEPVKQQPSVAPRTEERTISPSSMESDHPARSDTASSPSDRRKLRDARSW